MSLEKSCVDDSHDSKLCVICCRTVDYFALGRCDHPVCYQCGVRMRILCKENICSVCRTELPQLIITKNPQPFHKINTKKLVKNHKTGLIYDSVEAEDLVRKLLEYQCTKCSDRPPERTFNQLRDHVKKQHSLFYCDICVDHLRVFSHEFKLYTRKQLATHRRVGDPDDTSHKGHPLCEFCEIRYLDNDELLRHLRKNHLWCHFCEKDGKHDLYYYDYESLRDHFRQEHYLCEEGDCLHEKFTSVFRTQIDFQAHKVSRHSKSMSKAVARQHRQLEVEINYPRRRGVNQMNSYGQEARGFSARETRGEATEGIRRSIVRSARSADERENGIEREAENIQIAMAQSLSLTTTERNRSADPQNKRAKKSKRPNSKPKLMDNKDEENTRHPGPLPSETLLEDSKKNNAIDSDVVMTDKTPVSSQKYDADFPTLSSGDVKDLPKAEQSEGPSGKLFRLPLRKETDFPSLPNDTGQYKQSNNKKVVTCDKAVRKAPKRVEENFPNLPSNTPALSALQNQEASGNVFSKALKLADEGQAASSVQPPGSSTQVLSLNDFPSLSVNPLPTSKPTPPPGLNNKRPPPGLLPQSKPLGPPPGLNVDKSVVLNNQRNPLSVMHVEPSEYSLPNNYQERNKSLISTIQGLLGQEKFQQFKALSGEFRQGNMSASDYYSNCCALFGSNMKKVFHELVALLPDPQKQQQLLTAHNDAKVLAKQNGDNVLKIASKTSEQATPWQKSENFTSCPYCYQFLSRKDLDHHLSAHSADQEFPSLSAAYSTRPPSGMKSGENAKVVWVKGK